MIMQYHGVIMAHWPWGSLASKIGTNVQAWPLQIASNQDQEIQLSGANSSSVCSVQITFVKNRPLS